jgi:hypothetical protein
VGWEGEGGVEGFQQERVVWRKQGLLEANAMHSFASSRAVRWRQQENNTRVCSCNNTKEQHKIGCSSILVLSLVFGRFL